MPTVLVLVALLLAGFLVPYLLMHVGGGSGGLATVPGRSVTR
jgi:hypothetical protein